MKLRFIDLFGAPGGMSLGMKMAGLQPVAVLDNFEEGLKTYGKNFPEVPEQNIVNADASEKDIVKIFQRQTGLRKSPIKSSHFLGEPRSHPPTSEIKIDLATQVPTDTPPPKRKSS